MMYSEADLATLDQGYNGIALQYNALIVALSARHYPSERAAELALHGLGRRLETLKSCIDIVFEAIPITLAELPTYEKLQLATVALQAYLINLFGAADDLAGLWVEQRNIRKANGLPLSDGQIGLGTGERYNIVRASFSDAFRAYLGTRAEWFEVMERFRHAVAHRIPLYIPPYGVDPANQAVHDGLDAQITQATLQQDFAAVEALEAQQRALRFFRPWMRHSILEGAPVLAIHPQMLADFNTIEELARTLLGELDQQVAPGP
jgi:hypothetical protein